MSENFLPGRLRSLRLRFCVLIVLSTSSDLAIFAQIAGPSTPANFSVEVQVADAVASADWLVDGRSTVVDDEILGVKVVEVDRRQRWSITSKATFSGNYVVEAWIRFPGPTPPGTNPAGVGSGVLRTGLQRHGGKSSPSYSLSVVRRGDRSHVVSPSVGDGSLWTQPARPDVAPIDNAGNRWLMQANERFPLDTISPIWDDEFRIGVENDMLALPLEQNRWRRLRVELRDDRVRMYHDGLLAFDEATGARTDGAVALEVLGPARIARLRIASLESLDARFEPIVLDDLVNATGFVAADSLPKSTELLRVGEVPLRLPARTSTAEHVDVGRSLFRYGRSTESIAGDPTFMWPTIGQLDPACLRVRAPQGTYSRLWLLAASDDDENSTPRITARIYKPRKGWSIDAAAEVPGLSAPVESQRSSGGSAGAISPRRVAVRRADGRSANLWLVPIELDAAALASEMRNELVLHLELTKEVHGFRAFPDPMYYGYYPAGLPSAVHVFAATLERAPIEFIAGGERGGNTYPYPERPRWNVTVKNPFDEPREAEVTVEVAAPLGGNERSQRKVRLAARDQTTISFRPRSNDFGLHSVRTTVVCNGETQRREGTFVTLPPDNRRATAKNTRWGLWFWNGAHNTNQNKAESLQLFRNYGSLVAGHAKLEDRTPWRLAQAPMLAFRATPAWALQDPYDPAEYAKYSEECGLFVAEKLKKEPDLEYVSIFAEHSISLRVTHGTPPEAFGKPWYDYTPEEKKSIRAHFLAAKAAFEGVRKHAPQVKFLFGHCGPLFSLPFMRDGYPKELFDGYGLDSPQFERMAERPPRAVECNFMYFLNQDMKRLGYDKELVHVESYYPPSHPLALGLRESADSIVRTAVLSLANGTDRFLSCWTLDDPEGAWGSQHYGAVGIIGRPPEMNPKPGAAAYGTLTQMLDTAKYDGYVPTGSRSAYCVRFKELPTKHVYALWTIRGRRPITVVAAAKKTKNAPDGEFVLTDENGNERRLEIVDGRATLELSSTAIWLTAVNTTVERVELGRPAYDERPGEQTQLLADFSTDAWTFSGRPNERYAGNSWDMPREPAAYATQTKPSTERGGDVVSVTCNAEIAAPNLTGRYGVYEPKQPIVVPGKARAFGLWANGNSGWGRVVYEIVDAKGEVFQSVGMKDQWNCDDTHSWSNFNFDGWRFLEFPLPGNAPGDDYRESDSVWWNHSAEGIVDLPVSLSRIMFEMPTHQIYVDEMLPVANLTVEIDELVAIYDSAENRTEAPIQRQRRAAGMLKQQSRGEGLPNPIAEARTAGTAPAPKITRFYAPEQFNDGTRIHCAIEPVAGAKEYQVWVAAYADGRGAKVMAKGAASEPLVNRLRPGRALHFFATYTDSEGRPSAPSPVATTTLKDEFLQK